MNLHTVTITGADNSIDPISLLALSEKYPFVEWGILFSPSNQGQDRFPTNGWLYDLTSLVTQKGIAQFSAHLCGRFVRDILKNGNFSWWNRYPSLKILVSSSSSKYTWAKGNPCPSRKYFTGNQPGSYNYGQVICQCDAVNDGWVRTLANFPERYVVPLFDTSGGNGVTPREWPKAWPTGYCGYAGGLGPDNLITELHRIEEVVGDDPIWIDMEQNIRSEREVGSLFDLHKVEKVLELVAPYITPIVRGL